MATLEEKILSGDFIYDPPYFYRNAWALRCKLGIGDSDEVFYAVARKRAAEIFTILFRNGVDMFFFDHCVYDYDFDSGTSVYIDHLIETESNLLKFCLSYEQKFQHKVVRHIPCDENDETNKNIVRKNRICCYPDKKLNAIDVINAQIGLQEDPMIHFVSFENNCIFSVYDERGCDIVFFDKSQFRKFYPLLQKYFLDHDITLMKQRFEDCMKT